MKSRMVPISQIFNNYPRLVRDLAKQHGKEIQLLISGENTELDKKITEEINKRMKVYPDTVVTDLGFRSQNNFKNTPFDK